ncbi:glutathione S-transferase family protein [Chelativorans sp. M5D2P16]|uniref:glutathione S-transferase family protein n=1 Tax=Chelativorans sp. M5D2P16 TaxID=3095678 RepID=UPI002ACAFE26|nr:glutathione S-transferase N-terminal domain-containing protein [Chelativorans sp. M5D2P16]MDZ5696745.1 glutathione S-transferase N-terminal domain-containing protein [Chelativorans sp. M5D2P16]
MIHLYTWTTPNSQKANIAVEEMGVTYKVVPVDIGQGEQFASDFLKISPNNKIPAIVDDRQGVTLMESGAILFYLGQLTGRLIPCSQRNYWSCIEWLFWHSAGQGPVSGQLGFFQTNADMAPFALDRFRKEVARLYSVMDKRLEEVEFLAEELSIADISAWPWVSRFGRIGIDLAEYPNVKRWYLEIANRPAVQRGFEILQPAEKIPLPE